jgi:hypothetical protein
MWTKWFTGSSSVVRRPISLRLLRSSFRATIPWYASLSDINSWWIWEIVRYFGSPRQDRINDDTSFGWIVARMLKYWSVNHARRGSSSKANPIRSIWWPAYGIRSRQFTENREDIQWLFEFQNFKVYHHIFGMCMTCGDLKNWVATFESTSYFTESSHGQARLRSSSQSDAEPRAVWEFIVRRRFLLLIWFPTKWQTNLMVTNLPPFAGCLGESLTIQPPLFNHRISTLLSLNETLDWTIFNFPRTRGTVRLSIFLNDGSNPWFATSHGSERIGKRPCNGWIDFLIRNFLHDVTIEGYPSAMWDRNLKTGHFFLYKKKGPELTTKTRSKHIFSRSMIRSLREIHQTINFEWLCLACTVEM